MRIWWVLVLIAACVPVKSETAAPRKRRPIGPRANPPELVDRGPETLQLGPEVEPEDVVVATVRVLNSRGFYFRVKDKGAGAADQGLLDQFGLIRTEWTDVEPRELRSGSDLLPIERRHSVRIVIGEGFVTLAVDCLERQPDLDFWAACLDLKRNNSYVAPLAGAATEILDQATARARWRHERPTAPSDH